MSSERARIALILTATVSAALGGAFYFFEVYRPRQVHAAAQDEIEAWEPRWQAARRCLVGERPVGDLAQTVAVGLLTGVPPDAHACYAELNALSRGEAPDTDLPAIEAAWRDLEHPIRDLAFATVNHADAHARALLPQDPLAPAIATLDRARNALRTAGGLAPVTAPTGQLPAAHIVPLRGIAELVDNCCVPSSDGMTLFGKTASGEAEIIVVPGHEPQVLPGTHTLTRSPADPTWGALATPTGLQIGAIAADGTIPGGKVVGNGPVRAVIGPVGTAAAGALVVDSNSQVTLATSIAGEVSERALGLATGLVADAPRAGGTALVWTGPDGAMQGMFLRPTGALPPIALGRGVPDKLCVVGDRAWLTTESASLIQFGATGPAKAPLSVAGYTLAGCSPDGVLLVGPQGYADGFALCGASCRTLELGRLAEPSIATTIAGDVVRIAASNGVLAVIPHGGAARVYAALPGLTPVYALSDGKVIDVIAKTPTGVVVATVPAT